MSSLAMTTGAHSGPGPLAVGGPEIEHIVNVNGLAGQQQRIFKKHKVLPHPKKDRHGYFGTNGVPRKYDLQIDTSLSRPSGSQPSSHSLRHHSRRISTGGPDFPPTPPTHSRTSS